ncbi:MAG TPA: N-formylglutamate amidohydrolase [Solirubrobacterales bacterium]|nr:N-formylglutamate amidohydrolase [Solirubrobacterales bacterium]
MPWNAEKPADQMDGNWLITEGDPESAVILHVPHASRAFPPRELNRLVVDREGLDAELDAITDADTERLAAEAAGLAELRPWIFENRYSRLLVDPERFPDDREEMLEAGMGPVYLKTTTGAEFRRADEADDERLMSEYYRPYASAFERLVEQRLERLGRVLLIDVHSFPRDPLPYELHSGEARPALCIGTDKFHTPQWLVDAISGLWPDTVELDQPFRGCYVPLSFLESESRIAAVMLELRRDVVARWAGPDSPGRRGEPGLPGFVAAVADLFSRYDPTG